jgi:hypothetical protein
MSINLKPVITAFDSVEKSNGSFKASVITLYSGCKTAADYIARRKEVNTKVDSTVKDVEKAKRLKASINTVLNRDLLNPANIKLVARKGGRKATKATKAAPTAAKAATKAAPTAATIQAATTADFLPVVAAWVAGKTKAELTSARQRVDGIFANAIANAK